METISVSRCFEGVQGVYRHASEACSCDMTFATFLPPQAEKASVPLVWYLSGLTCTHQNVMDKGEYRRVAAELGVAIVCPDTSSSGGPRARRQERLEVWKRGWNLSRRHAGALCEKLSDGQLHRRRTSGHRRPKLPCRYVPAGHFRPFNGRPWRDYASAETPGSLPIRLGVCPDLSAIHGEMVPARIREISGRRRAGLASARFRLPHRRWKEGSRVVG